MPCQHCKQFCYITYIVQVYYNNVLVFVAVPLPPTDVRLNLEFDNGTPNINALWMVNIL